ncbi:hypothetical protein BJ166DRAFT_575971 [Pestalotiopsis sp. NC0098]|nr:hypothetical protein BJ166DRAFT_575971 [Pestalotiopsis sp. NC0098]
MSGFLDICPDSQSQAGISREEEEIYAGFFANDIEALLLHRDGSQVVQAPYEDPPIPWYRLAPILGTFFQDVFHDWDSIRALYQTLDLRVANPTSHPLLLQLPAAVHTPNWKHPHSLQGQLQANRNAKMQSTTSSKHQHILPKHTPQKRPLEVSTAGMTDQVNTSASQDEDEVELLPTSRQVPRETTVAPGDIVTRQDSREGTRFSSEGQYESHRLERTKCERPSSDELSCTNLGTT